MAGTLKRSGPFKRAINLYDSKCKRDATKPGTIELAPDPKYLCCVQRLLSLGGHRPAIYPQFLFGNLYVLTL